jgi:hypothetical protein
MLASLPAGAKPWKCAAVAGPVKLAKLTFNVSFLVASLKVIATEPGPLLSLGGDFVRCLQLSLRVNRGGCRWATNASKTAPTKIIMLHRYSG